MIKRISKWLSPPLFAGDEENTAQARLINRVGVFFALLLITGGFFFVPFFSDRPLESLTAIFTLLIIYVVSRWLLFKGRVQASGALLSCAAWLTWVGFSFLSGGVSSPFMFTVLAATVTISLLLDWRFGLFFTFAAILICLQIAFVQQAGLIPPSFFEISPLSTWFIFTMTLVFIAGLTNLILYNLKRSLETSRTQQKALQAAEATLRENAERQNLILEACSDGVWDWDVPSGETLFSPGYTQPLGYEPGEFVQTFAEWRDCVHPQDVERVIQAHDAALQPGGQLSVEFRMRDKSGRWRWVLSRGVVIERDSQGHGLRMVGTHTDIQTLKESGEALRESQITLAAIINSTPDMIWSVDPESFAMQTFNQGLSDYFLKWLGVLIRPGMLPLQVLGRQEYAERWEAFYRRALAEGAYTTEYNVIAGTLILELNFNLLKRDDALYGISVFARDITQLKQAEAALRESETRFRSISENSMTGIYTIQAGRLTYINPALAHILGGSVEELTGADPLLVIHPDDQALVAENMRRRLAGEVDRLHYEFRSRGKDGSSRNCEVLGTRVDLQGQPAIIGTIIDITERRQAEEVSQRRTAELTALSEVGQALSKLAEPSEILEQVYKVIGQVLDNSNLYIALYDEASQYISFPLYTLHGVREDGGGRTLADGLTDYIIRNNQPILIKRDMDAAITGLGIGFYGVPACCFLAVPLHIDQRVLGVIALQDYERENVYDEHHLELLTTIASQAMVALENARLFQAAQTSQARFRAVVEYNHDGIIMLNPDRQVLYASPSYARLIGYPPAELQGTAGVIYIHPQDQEFVDGVFAGLLQQPGGFVSLEYRLHHKDGHWLWVETTAANLLEIPDVCAIVLNSHDISERKRAEEALRESEERYRLLVDHSPNGIIVHSAGKVDFINQAGARLMGAASPQDLIGKPVLDFIHPDRREIVVERLRIAAEKNEALPVIENIYVRLDGQPVTVESSAVPFTLGGRFSILTTVTDISERKQAEESLRRRNAHLQALQETSLELVSQLDLPTLLQNIVKRAGQLLGTDSGYLDMVEKGANRLAPMVGLGALAESLKFPVQPGEGIAGLVWQTRQPMVVDDYDSWPGHVTGLAHGLIRAAISVPLILETSEAGAHSGTEVLGVLGLAYRPEMDRKFGDDEIRLLSDFARLAVMAIQNARLYQQATQEISERKLAQTRLKKRAAQLTLIKDVGQKIAGVLDPQGLLELAARLVNEAFGYHHVALFTVDEEKKQLVMRARAGKFNHLFPQDHRLMLGDGMVGYVAKTGRLLLARDVSKERRYKNYYPDLIPTQSELSLPLKIGGLVVGVLDVQSPQVNAFGCEDLNVLQTLADEVSVALENARLYESIQRELAERRRVEAELLNYRDHLEDMVQQRTSQLEIAMREAEAANRAKSDFLAVMSHEIRTPLNGVLGLTHLALQTSLNEKQRDYLSRVEDSGENLLSIINDILDFSKIESGRLDLEQVDFELDDILQGLSNAMSFQAQRKAIELVYDIGPDVPRHLVGDSQRLRQVLLNLAGNAVKFTETGEVVLKIRLRQRDAEQRAIFDFSVQDTGIGMTSQQVAGLFQPFNQVDSSTSRKYGGTGLGLAISQRLVKLMGGEITVQSELGRGTVFSFSLSIACQPVQEREILTFPLQLNGLRVLVLDKSPILLAFLQTTLESFSCQVTALPGVENVAQALQSEFDLLMLDWNLAGYLRGTEEGRRLRKHPSLARAHVIMLASSQEMLNHAGSEIDGFLLKPVTRLRLLDAVMTTFGYTSTRAPETGAPGAGRLQTGALRGRRVLVVEDNNINQIVARDMLQNLGLIVSLAESGEQGLELLAAEHFDAVLMDIQMPGMDGYQTTAHIRANPRFAAPRLPVIAMTAHAMTSDRDKALLAGLDDYVSKPVNADRLTEVLLRWLPPTGEPVVPQTSEVSPVFGASEVGREPPRPGAAAPADAGLPRQILACLNTAAAINRLGGDQKLYRRILGLFREEHSGLLEEIREALQQADEPLARSRAHSLKGLAGTLGADEIMALSKQLETDIASGDPASVQDCLSDLQPRFAALISALELLTP